MAGALLQPFSKRPETSTGKRRTSRRLENDRQAKRKSPQPTGPEIIDLSNDDPVLPPTPEIARTRRSPTVRNGTVLHRNVSERRQTDTPPRCRTRSQSRRIAKRMDVEDFQELWMRAEETLGASAEDMEQHSSFRAANTVMKSHDSEFQRTAQYGRVEAMATYTVLNQLELQATDTFLDIGHGIGNIVLMAGYLFQCESRGIEVVRDRHQVAVKFERALEVARLNLEREQNANFNLGTISMQAGRLENPSNFDFLTKPSGEEGKMKVFCNNFGAVFSDKSAKASHKYFLDDYIAGLFAIMPEGSIIITFSRLTFPAARSQILKQRQGAEETGFYELQEINLGPVKDAVSWASGSNVRDLIAYKYTRVGPSSYICWKCGETQNAAKKLPTGELVQNYCKCPDNVSCLRQRPKKKVRESI